MREPPGDLADDTLRACLRDHYGLAVVRLAFLPLGHDNAAWAYRAETDAGRAYFVKVRARIANAAGLVVPRHLRDQGLAGIVAPLPAATGDLWAPAGHYAAILYPFIAGDTAMARGMTDEGWVAYGATLRRVHDAPITSGLAGVLARESFAPDGTDEARRLDAQIGAQPFADPEQEALAALWRARRADIRRLLDRAAALGRRLAATATALALCHADIHTNNVLVGDAGAVWFVDWDEAMLAPRERDLLFVTGGGLWRGLVAPREEALFFRGYGPVAVDPHALAYYRHARAVSDLAYEAWPVFYRSDLGRATRREAVERTHRLFAPGRMVELALASGAEGA